MTAKRFGVINYSDGSGMYGVSDRIAEITVAWDESKLIMDNLCDLLNELHEENQLLKQRLAQNDVEWLRNNTIWQVMPSSHRTYTSTIYHRRNDE